MEIVLRAVVDPSKKWVIHERAEIGRLQGVEVCLRDPSVSKLHAIIERSERGYVLADLGSKNSTRVNGVPVEHSAELALGDRLQFGTIELLVDSFRRAGDGGGAAEAALLLRLCQSLLSAPNLEEVWRVALDQFIDLTRADRSAILLLHGEELRCMLGRYRGKSGGLEDLPPGEFEFTRTLASSVMAEGHSRIVHNAFEDEMLSNVRSVVDLGVSGAVCVPLIAPKWGGGVKRLGVLYGDSVHAIVSAVPMDLLESIGGLMALAIETSRIQRDLRKQSILLEEKVTERTAELELKHRQLLESEKMAATGLLAAGVAHELGNALLQVSANAELISEFVDSLRASLGEEGSKATGTNGEAELELLDDLKYANQLCILGAQMAQHTVQDLKSFARLDEATVKLVSLDEALETVVNLVEKGVGRHQCFERRLLDLPRIWCHPERLNQVFLNLLVNAVQASESGNRIWISCRIEDDSFHYTIEDEGSGIEPEIVGRIFDPFFTTKKVGEGSGLGLALAYQTVAEHGGRITVESTAGQGSRFEVVLPRSLEQNPPVPRS